MTDPEASRIGRNNKNRGKANERRVSSDGGPLERFFGEPFARNPITGVALADCESEHWVIEVKHRQTGLALIRNAWKQVAAAAEQTGKKPALLLSLKEEGKLVDYVVVKVER